MAENEDNCKSGICNFQEEFHAFDLLGHDGFRFILRDRRGQAGVRDSVCHYRLLIRPGVRSQRCSVAERTHRQRRSLCCSSAVCGGRAGQAGPHHAHSLPITFNRILHRRVVPMAKNAIATLGGLNVSDFDLADSAGVRRRTPGR